MKEMAHWLHARRRAKFRWPGAILLSLALAWSAPAGQKQKHERGPGKEMASGAGNIGTGVAKGAGNLAKGTAKGAGDLVTLHPVDAGASLGKGAVSAGKDAGAGTVKGTGKITKGVGREFKKLF